MAKVQPEVSLTSHDIGFKIMTELVKTYALVPLVDHLRLHLAVGAHRLVAGEL